MGNFLDKQPSSRPVKYQTLAFLGTLSVPSTNFAGATQHIRVTTETAGWLVIGDGTAVTCTAQSDSMKISSGQPGEYFAVTPGQMCAFISTSATTFLVNIVEMA